MLFCLHGQAGHPRQAEAEHFDFALRLYLLTMQPYVQELVAWNEPEQRATFAAQWKLDEVSIISVSIISVEGNDVGWLQVAELPAEIRLQKFYVSPQYQGSGIGAEVLGNLLITWRSTGKKIVLRVLVNNPARRLYKRLGFSVTLEDGFLLRMRA